jgi:hypothetical protein
MDTIIRFLISAEENYCDGVDLIPGLENLMDS